MANLQQIRIGGRTLGDGQPCFIVAEISCNHQQKKSVALRLIEEAKKAGADAVKFQTYTPDTLTLDVSREPEEIRRNFAIKGGTLWDGRTLHDLYGEAYTPWDWFGELQQKARALGLEFFSSPFDESAVDLLEKLKVPAYKIASFEINHIPLIRYAASKKKPMILSTGVADEGLIARAIQAIRNEGNDQILLLKCTSAYPALVSEANLRTIPDMRKRFGVEVGLSDHTTSALAPAIAVSLGARLVEKHFTLEKKGPDATFSLTPEEFGEMVRNIRECESAMGQVSYAPTEGAGHHRFLMRSIFVKAPIKKGEKFSKENLQVVRPGMGMDPGKWDEVLGKKAARTLRKGEPLKDDMVA